MDTIVKTQVGADLGNDSLKLVFDEKTHYTIKNSVSRRSMNEIRRNLNIDSDNDASERGEKGKRQLKNLDVIVRPAGGKEERFYIGDLAIEAGEDETVVGTEKANNPHIHIPMLAMLALHTPRSRKEVHFDVVCGLPVKQFNKEARARMSERLIGQFEVTLMEANGQRGRKVVINIENVLIAPEGVPVLMNQMLNEDATDLTRPELRVGSYGIIDIGAFTTDIPVIVDGKPDSMASDGLDEGIATYIDKIATALSDANKAIVTRNQLLDKILSGETEMSVRGRVFPIRDEVEDQMQVFAQKIIDKIDRLWSKSYEIKEFFVVGGGGRMLRPYLSKVMTQRDIQLKFIEMRTAKDHQNDPQLQNAFGYWKIAKQRYGA